VGSRPSPNIKVLKGFFFEVPLIDKSIFRAKRKVLSNTKKKTLELTRVEHGDKEF
jgi:hypothetical protein